MAAVSFPETKTMMSSSSIATTNTTTNTTKPVSTTTTTTTITTTTTTVADSIHALAKQAWNTTQYAEAAALWSIGLSCVSLDAPLLTTFLRNRSKAYSKISEYGLALDDIESVLRLQNLLDDGAITSPSFDRTDKNFESWRRVVADLLQFAILLDRCKRWDTAMRMNTWIVSNAQLHGHSDKPEVQKCARRTKELARHLVNLEAADAKHTDDEIKDVRNVRHHILNEKQRASMDKRVKTHNHTTVRDMYSIMIDEVKWTTTKGIGEQLSEAIRKALSELFTALSFPSASYVASLVNISIPTSTSFSSFSSSSSSSSSSTTSKKATTTTSSTTKNLVLGMSTAMRGALIANGLSIRHVVGCGQGVYAEKVFEEGEIVWIEDPWLYASSDCDACDHCALLLPSTKTLCGGCNDAVYCSDTCRNMAAPLHKFVCGIITTKTRRRIAETGFTTTSRQTLVFVQWIALILAVCSSANGWSERQSPLYLHTLEKNKTVIEKKEEVHTTETKMPTSIVPLAALPHYWVQLWLASLAEKDDQTKESDMDRIVLPYQQYRSLCESWSSKDCLDHKTKFAMWQHPLLLNAANAATACKLTLTYSFSVKTPSDRHHNRSGGVPSGLAVYRVASLFNHSCVPNLEWNHSCDSKGAVQPNAIQFIATRRIDVGEQLFVSYIDETRSYRERQDGLRSYGFKCACARCVSDSSPSSA